MNKQRTIIKIKNIYKSFSTGSRYTQVLKDITTDIYEGEFLIIYGPSGCGKSTLLHSIMGLERPDKGEVDFYGIDISKMNTDDIASIRKRDMGIMYQQQNWIKALNVRENLAFSAQLLGMDKEEALQKANKVLKLVDMEYRADYIPSELSAGEQQKIGIARALITKPKILIADEPTGNLDVKSGFVVAELLKTLVKEGITVIMVTHNPDYLTYADRVIFMVDGKLYREVNVHEENVEEIEQDIRKNLQNIINEGASSDREAILKKNKIGNEEYEIPQKNIWQKLTYAVYFNLRFVSQIFIILYLRIVNLLSKRFEMLKHYQKDVRQKFDSICRVLEGNGHDKISSSINSLDLTEVSIKNLSVKKSRTYITIFGISLGIGFIVFLLSIGYGMERLIISEITKAENQRQVDVLPVAGSGVEINSSLVEQIKSISGVTKVYPLINLAARVAYNGANTDVVAYGVTEGYLEDSSTSLLAGNYLKEDDSQTVKNNETQIIVNKAYVDALEMSTAGMLDKSLSINFINSNSNTTENDNSTALLYKIVGVVDDTNPPVIYLMQDALGDYKSDIYSELRVVLQSNNNEQQIRQQIEVLGLQTNSVMDTISQVQNLFQYVRVVLLLLGVIAFIIAILGMVNTLTVSLLERTREVGLMKTIGMRSTEIQTLFINESMTMGFAGGLLGVVMGILGGGLASLVLSLISLSRGGEIVNISFLPWTVAIAIVLSSTFIGYITGLYPSNRAVKMNALDALRYE